MAAPSLEQLASLVRTFEATRSVPAKRELVLAYNSVAMESLARGDSVTSLDLLNRAKALSDEPATSVTTLNNIACWHRRHGKPKGALRYLRRAVDCAAAAAWEAETGGGRRPEGSSATIAIGVIHLNMCAVLSELGRHNDALTHAQLAVHHCQAELLPESHAELGAYDEVRLEGRARASTHHCPRRGRPDRRALPLLGAKATLVCHLYSTRMHGSPPTPALGPTIGFGVPQQRDGFAAGVLPLALSRAHVPYASVASSSPPLALGWILCTRLTLFFPAHALVVVSPHL